MIHLPKIFALLSLLVALTAACECHGQDAKQSQKAERDRLWAAASEARSRGELSKAAELGERMLAIEKAWLGEKHKKIISSNHWLADVYQKQEDWQQTESKRKDALAVSVAIHGKKNWQTTDARLALADAQLRSRLTPEQNRKLKEASRLANRGVASYRSGDYAKAAADMKAAGKIRANVLSEEHPDYATTLNNIACLLYTSPSPRDQRGSRMPSSA